jgi:glycine/D-amino acid oxidase-like deaminating enzyme
VSTAVDVAARRRLSLWWDQLPEDEASSVRPALGGDLDADVVIVGAGYTGLWTAYYLASADPSLRVVVLEKEVAGFGASGRNGGWCSALFPASMAKIARESTREQAVAMEHAMQGTVDEVGRVVAAEGIDCRWAKGGSVYLARTALQLERAREEVQEWASWGFGDEHYRLLGAAEARERLGATDVLGGVYTPHCAAIQPAMLARGLAHAVDRLGVTVYEGTEVTGISQGQATTTRGTVRAPFIIRATEGYTATIPGFRRDVAPVYSLMLATEPLPDSVWDQIGLRERETFNDLRHLIIYGQRTADGRFAFGGRGAPYHYASEIKAEHDREPEVYRDLWRVLTDLFPVLRDHAVTHTWGGPLGVPRDWFASVGLDESTGIGWAGGYVGDGVGTTNLAGRTLADLVLRRSTELTSLPWVGHRSPRWEPEPLRWIGTNLGLRLMSSADAAEARTGKPSRAAAFFGRFTGH